MKNSAYLFLILILSACENKTDDVKKFADPDNIYIEILKDIRLIHNELGHTSAIIYAPLLYHYTKNENKLTFPEGLQIELYENETLTAIINAGYGEKDEITKLVKASKGVKITNYKKEQMESEELTWNENLSQVSIEGKVKISTPTDIIQGYGLISDDNFRNYKMSKITGIVNIEGDNIPK